MQVGDKVYLLPVGNSARPYRNSDRNIRDGIKEDKIIKIGRKYFYLENENENKFSLEYMHDVSDYSAEWEVYLSKQAVLDVIEKTELERAVRRQLDWSSLQHLSLNQLRRIKAIIEEEKDE